MKKSEQTGNETRNEELWSFDPVDTFEPPHPVLRMGTVKKRFSAIVQGVFGRNRSSDSPFDIEEDLLTLPDEELDRVAGIPDWSAAATALHRRLTPWLEAEHPAKPVVFYVAPPYGGRREILHTWANEHDVRTIAEPEESAILDRNPQWFDNWPEHGPWLLPRLEKCFIRQAEGLEFVRELLARVLSDEMGRGVIGCDSWAWAFLQHVWTARPSFTITLHAFGHEHLERLFYSIIDRNRYDTEIRFRRADNGADVLPLSDEDDQISTSDTFFKQLAEYCRGNIGVARTCWRSALRRLPEKQVEQSDDLNRQERRHTVWVSSWDETDRPTLPRDAGENARFVLHTLLLHDGLSVERLSVLLPPDRAALTETLLYLAETGLVERVEGVWRVTALGYPHVRNMLQMNDYVTDMF